MINTPLYKVFPRGPSDIGLSPILGEREDGSPNPDFGATLAMRQIVGAEINHQLHRRRDSGVAALLPLGRRAAVTPAQHHAYQKRAKGKRRIDAQDREAIGAEARDVLRDVQTALLVRFAEVGAARLRHDGVVPSAVAGQVDDLGIDRELGRYLLDRAGIRRDALSAAGGIAENLTYLAFRFFRQPEAPLNGDEVFTTEGGFDCSTLQLQMLFNYSTGEAQVYEGGAVSNAIGAPGFESENLTIYTFISESPVNFIDRAREARMGANPMGEREHANDRAHRTLHNRLKFGIGAGLPAELLVRSYRYHPGVKTLSKGLSTGSMTGANLYEFMADMIEGPKEASSQVFVPTMLGMSPKLAADAKRLVLTSGDATTVWDQFAKNYPNVRIVEMWELRNLVASSTEAMISMPDSGLASPTYFGTSPIYLPQFTDGLNVYLRMISSSAGMHIPAPLGCRIGYITRS